MRILIAEDDLIAQELIRVFLRQHGFDVTISDNGDDAWKLFQQHPTRFVITDCNMPGISGLEFCRRIREEYEGRYTYVIMLTANKYNISGLAAGADDYVTKPFNPDELRFRIKAGQRVLELEDRLEDQIRELNESREALDSTHQRLRTELNAAADLQRALLPKELPESKAVNFAWSFEPSAQLGGDTFNVFQLAKHRYAFTLADVCGHGIKPALLAVTLQHVLDPRYRHTPLLWADFATDQATRVVPPTEVLARLNQQFPMDMEVGQYFTMLYCVLNSETGKMHYATAGHPPPILIPADGAPRQLPGTGMPIGIQEDNDFDHQSVTLTPGDRLLLFSDGLIEAFNADGSLVGTQRVLGWLDESRALDADGQVKVLSRNVRAWAADGRPDDDVAILMVEFNGDTALSPNKAVADACDSILSG